MARQKRLDRAIGLARALGRRRPGGVELLIAGPDDGERTSLEALAASGPDQQAAAISFSGPLDRGAVSAAASAAHVFVQLSDVEGYAMSAHEAMAAGMVCVLTPVGDLAVDAHDGVDAVCHHGDLEDTADRLLAVTDDPAAFAAMGHAARRAGSTGFVQDFVDVCRELASGPGRERGRGR